MTEAGGIALVTGASSGIGRHTAVMLAEKGFEVIGAARRPQRLEELRQELPGFRPMPVDLSRPEDTERFCREIEALDRPVKLLVNSAGYALRGLAEQVSPADCRRLFQVNFFPF